LKRCIDYAVENNINVLTKEISVQTSEATLEQSKAAQAPSLSFSTSFGANFKNVSTINEYMENTGGATMSNNFGLNSGMTLYNGGKIRNTIKQNSLQSDAARYDLDQSRMDIEISVAQAYLQVLYNKEALDINKKAAELSKKQVERGEQLFAAGSISKVDLAQLKSQMASDEYQIVSAENALSVAKLQLKQLLELGLEERFELYFPEIGDEIVSQPVPSLSEVYYVAVEDLPGMKSSNLSVDAADMAVKIARAAYAPSISLSAGISTGAVSGVENTYFDQLGNKLGESLGINLSLPIFNNKQTKTNVAKAKLQSESVRLQNESQKKQLLSTLETLHNDAVSAQHQYSSSQAKLEAAEESYSLVREQFDAGIKNTVELMTEENNYISALSQKLQAKYKAVLALKLLNRYMNEPIEL
jgi:Outer membrane protein